MTKKASIRENHYSFCSYDSAVFFPSLAVSKGEKRRKETFLSSPWIAPHSLCFSSLLLSSHASFHASILSPSIPVLWSENNLESPSLFSFHFPIEMQWHPYTASITYTAVIRGKVALPCDITPSSQDDSVALILWYKDDALTPIFTLDSRKGFLDQARTLTSSSLDNRAYFNSHNRPAFLHIDPIKLSDAGDYRCRVDFKRGRTVNTVISLKVIVPPEEPVITDMNGNELKGLIGPYNEGETLRMLCSSSGGQPRPTLTWFRDYTVIDDSFEYNEKDVALNQLTITALQRHHLLSIFTCQAVNNNITIPASTSVTLDLNCEYLLSRVTKAAVVVVEYKCNKCFPFTSWQ